MGRGRWGGWQHGRGGGQWGGSDGEEGNGEGEMGKGAMEREGKEVGKAHGIPRWNELHFFLTLLTRATQAHGMPGWNEVIFLTLFTRETPGTPASLY